MEAHWMMAAGAALTASHALASPIELTARGSSVTGSTFEFVMTYESSTMGTVPDPEGSTFYDAVLSAQAWIDGILEFDVGSNAELGIFRNISIQDDLTLGGPTGPLFDGFSALLASQSTGDIVNFILRDFNASAHNGSALPTSLDLTDYENQSFTFIPISGAPTEFTINFLETRVVPAPASAACGLGLLLVSARRRR